MRTHLRIAIMGIRGLPLEDLTFGGFEAFIAELAPRLAARGHDVTVYCRRDLYSHRPPQHRGVRLRYIPSIEHKVLGTPLHMTLCTLDALLRNYDSILVLNSGNGIQCALLRALTSARIALNMDGLEWERGKWGSIGRRYFRAASAVGARVVHVPIADSRAIGRILDREFRITTTFIPYATDLYTDPSANAVESLGLTPHNYALVVGRLVPENRTDLLIAGYRKSGIDMPMVVVGSANYRSDFHRHLEGLATPKTRFLGHIHDQRLLWQLFRHSRIYLHGHSVGGTNPGLLQALAAGCLIAANDVVFNREVMDAAGTYFRETENSVAEAIRRVLDLSDAEAAAWRLRARARILEGGYSWEQVVPQYEASLERPS